jgi:hypothetical protein
MDMSARIALLLAAGCLAACGGGGPPTDAGTEAALPDGAVPDDGLPDGGLPDEGLPDEGTPDTAADGTPDEGPAPGTGTCADIKSCAVPCRTISCVTECMALGTPEAQEAFTAMGRCRDEQCGEFGEDRPLQGVRCLYTTCRDFYEPCTPAGRLSCQGILRCAQACGMTNVECQQGCLADATYAAQVAFVGIGACLEENCPDAMTDEEAALRCLTGPCMSAVAGCR